MKKQKFKRRFIKRVLTRFHMALILLGTILSGVIFSKILLVFGLEHMLIRFICVLTFSYLCFFLFMKIWLHYLTAPYRKESVDAGLLDAVDAVRGVSDFSSSGAARVIKGQGGEFGGAGASGGWGDVGAVSDTAVSEGAVNSAGAVGETSARTAGEVISGLADEGGILLIFLALLLLGIFGSGIYIIWEAPAILSEAAFELILATSLIKKAKKIDNPNWVGSVFRSTWLAFLATLVITIIAGGALMSHCPSATKITEVFRFCL